MSNRLTRILSLFLLWGNYFVNIYGQNPLLTPEQKINNADASRKMHLSSLLPPGYGQSSAGYKQSYKTPVKNFFPPASLEKNEVSGCIDSSFVKLFETTTNRSYSFGCSGKTNDGGILIGGYGKDRTVPSPWYAVVTKFDSIGNHIWSREIESNVYDALIIQSVGELSDGTILVTGTHANSLYYMPPTEYHDFFVCKLSATGNLIWLRTFHSPLVVNCSSGNIYYASFAEGVNGDLVIGATIWNCPYPKYLVVFKLNSSGMLQWQYSFKDPSNDSFCGGIFYDAGGVTVINRASNVYSGGDNVIHVDLLKLDYMNGNLVSYKPWKVNMPFPSSFDFGFTNNIVSVRLTNGNYCVYGQTFGVYNSNPNNNTPHFAVLEFNSNYDFVRGYSIRSAIIGNDAVDRIKVDKDKRVLYSIYHTVTYPDVDLYIGSEINGQMLNQRKKEYRNREVFWNNFEIFGNSSYVFINNLATVGQSNFFLEYSKLHNSDTGSACLGLTADFSSIDSLQYVPYTFNWSQITSNPIIATNNQNNGSTPLNYIASPPCIQKASCDTLKIHGINTSCDFQQDFIFTAYRSPLCGSRVNWSINQSVIQLFQIINDTTIKIHLNQVWQGWLYAEIITSCGITRDSMLISIVPSPGQVNLGPDQQLCQINTLTLNAHSGYATYLWNDGSSDSLLIVTTPGIYFVHVTDGCGGSFSDTVTISAALPVPIDIGPDRTKCNNDTLHLNAPGGFLNYNWGPNYNISSLTAQNVIVQPAVDTIYFVKAEKTPGCFTFDTVRITVHNSQPINLGPDKNVCNGDSALLNAGAGFNQYLWSTGGTFPQIVVYTSGTYSIIGTSSNGCKSYDTLRINVWSKPVVQLNKDSTLCAGSNRKLQAGVFNNYLWQDGSVLPTFNVTGTGNYYVTVTDNNSCKASDTVRITKLLPLPSAFLPVDTALCNSSTMMLRPLINYNSYLWSNGANTPSITISQPGTYWLSVTDNNQCIGKDTINVAAKECIKGFYIPTGFTPDNNGKNDFFKPIIFGSVIRYEFIIYNRWGQTVFKTNDLAKGWDGRFGGLNQDGNVFVWICVYQMEGQQVKHEKGTFILIR